MKLKVYEGEELEKLYRQTSAYSLRDWGRRARQDVALDGPRSQWHWDLSRFARQ